MGDMQGGVTKRGDTHGGVTKRGDTHGGVTKRGDTKVLKMVCIMEGGCC